MNGQPNERFPKIEDGRSHSVASDLAMVALQASQLVDDFSGVRRVPRYADGHRESDVEHSYMLTVAAPEMAHILNVGLDIDMVRRFAVAHDLLELKVGDVETFTLNAAQLAEKERLEEAAREELYNELPHLLASDLEEYERQDSVEAVFVRLVDKLLPVAVDITGDGVRIMHEDYGVNSLEDLEKSHVALQTRFADKYGAEFPDLIDAYTVLCQMFEVKFHEADIEETTKEKTRGPIETEVKYLVDLADLPAGIDLNSVPKKRLRQGYVAIGEDGSETRVRSTNDEQFELTIKGPGLIARGEQTVKISKEMFDGLWLQTTGRQISKTRFYIPLGDSTIELDMYEGRLEGLVTAEVEFGGRPSEAMVRAAAFEPPEWFGRDVRNDVRYKNHRLSQEVPFDPTPLGAKQF